MNRSEKLRILKDPSAAATFAMRDAFARVQTVKGDAGRTPIKGLDYFTAEEINAIIEYLRAVLKNDYTPKKGVHYFDGYTPKKGVDYFDGQDGNTPELGVDYWTEQERNAIIAEAAARAKGQDGVSPKMSDIVDSVMGEIKKNKLEYGHLKDAPNLKDVQSLIEFLKRGGFRGGGSSGGSTASTAQTADLSSQCDGVNKVFTLSTSATTILSLIGSDAPIIYRPSVDFVLSPSTIITLSSGVNAPSNGATLIATYV